MVKFIKKNYAYICLTVCALIMLWRSFMGFCWTDESFYISTTDRFFKGDLPLVDEWYRTQMSSIIMLPLYNLYILITGTNAGIVLYFRLVFLAIMIAVSLLFYRVIRKEYPEYVATGAALFVLCFAHLNMATFSYYMMSNIFLSAALILVYDYKNSKSRVRLVIAGVMTALAVMSMPAFVIVYVLMMLAVFVMIALGKNRRELWEITVYTIAGIAIPAILFMVYLFMHMNLEYLTETLPYVLTDNEHSDTLGFLIRKPHRCMLSAFGIYTWAAYAMIAVSFLFQKILKRHPLRELVILADVVLFVLMTYVSFGYTGYVSVAFFVFIIPLYFISEKKNKGMFLIMVIPAALVAFVYCLASSDFLYIMALGFAIATGAGICIIYDLATGNKETSEDKGGVLSKAAGYLAGGVFVCMLAITFYLRIVNVYRDAPISELDARIPEGIAKGIYTTEEHLAQYTDVYDMIDGYCLDTSKFEVISGNPKGNILFSKVLPWGYAASNLSCGYPTTWRSTAYSKDQLDIYYDIHPDKRPDVIIILDDVYGSYDACGDCEDDHEPNLDELPDHWRDYIRDNDLDEIRVKCGTVYCRSRQ